MLILYTKIIPGGLCKCPLRLFTKRSSIYCFWNLFSVPYLCLHVDDPPCPASVNYCLTAKLLKGQCPAYEWHDLNITNSMTFVL